MSWKSGSVRLRAPRAQSVRGVGENRAKSVARAKNRVRRFPSVRGIVTRRNRPWDDDYICERVRRMERSVVALVLSPLDFAGCTDQVKQESSIMRG